MTGSEGRKSPSGFQGQDPHSSEADDIFLKSCINTLPTETLHNIYSTKSTFTTFPGVGGQLPVLPVPADAHDLTTTLQLKKETKKRMYLTLSSVSFLTPCYTHDAAH